MLLSAAIIVRDEAEHLDGCLTSLRGLVDEIVVVDTGSTDASVEVATRHGAIVAHEPWQGDFATPRNRSLDLCSGEWILYIDADERLRAGDNEERRARLAAASDHAAFRIVFVPRVGFTPYLEYRLWRHRPDVRFSGRMHESIVSAIHAAADRTGQLVGVSDVVTIDHFGYEGDQRHKHARDEPILLAALADHPERIFYYDHLARIYQALGRDEEAAAMWSRGIEVARARGGTDNDDRLLWINLIMHGFVRGQLEGELSGLVEEALERFPRLPALELAAAQIEFVAGDAARALPRVEWLTGLSLDEIVATGSSYDDRVFGEWALNLLGLCRFALGDFAGAAEAFAAAEAAAPGVPDYGVRRRLAQARVAASPG
ncbi:MAG TPA: glycosyltransferase family 2 protein [Solirubrobacteraceae bacterium]|jgi:glycosyltransferase involved in cell wall biosynthesis